MEKLTSSRFASRRSDGSRTRRTTGTTSCCASRCPTVAGVRQGGERLNGFRLLQPKEDRRMQRSPNGTHWTTTWRSWLRSVGRNAFQSCTPGLWRDVPQAAQAWCSWRVWHFLTRRPSGRVSRARSRQVSRAKVKRMRDGRPGASKMTFAMLDGPLRIDSELIAFAAKEWRCYHGSLQESLVIASGALGPSSTSAWCAAMSSSGGL